MERVNWVPSFMWATLAYSVDKVSKRCSPTSGAVVSAQVIMDRETNRSKVFRFRRNGVGSGGAGGDRRPQRQEHRRTNLTVNEARPQGRGGGGGSAAAVERSSVAVAAVAWWWRFWRRWPTRGGGGGGGGGGGWRRRSLLIVPRPRGYPDRGASRFVRSLLAFWWCLHKKPACAGVFTFLPWQAVPGGLEMLQHQLDAGDPLYSFTASRKAAWMLGLAGSAWLNWIASMRVLPFQLQFEVLVFRMRWFSTGRCRRRPAGRSPGPRSRAPAGGRFRGCEAVSRAPSVSGGRRVRSAGSMRLCTTPKRSPRSGARSVSRIVRPAAIARLPSGG